MYNWKLAAIVSCGLVALVARMSLAVVVEDSVTPDYLKKHPRAFDVKAERRDDGLLHFTVSRYFVRPTYVVARIVVRDGKAVVFETHFPAFVREKSATYSFALPAKFVTESAFELSEGSFSQSGDELTPLPSGIIYQIRLAEFAKRADVSPAN